MLHLLRRSVGTTANKTSSRRRHLASRTNVPCSRPLSSSPLFAADDTREWRQADETGNKSSLPMGPATRTDRDRFLNTTFVNGRDSSSAHGAVYAFASSTDEAPREKHWRTRTLTPVQSEMALLVLAKSRGHFATTVLESSDALLLSENPPTTHIAAWRAISNTSVRRPGHSLMGRGRGLEPLSGRSHVTQSQLFFSTESDGKKLGKPPSPRIGTTKVPTPASPPVQTNPFASLVASPKVVIQKGVDFIMTIAKTLLGFLIKLPGSVWFYITHPTDRKERIAGLKQMARDEAHHYWVGSKLLWADIQTARNLLGKTLEGDTLTRRERKQLLRTVSDLFRLVPFSMFVLIPFMEFALPLALRLFPNMLPSTFQDSLKAEENMKRELKSRIVMAQFFQETMEELAKEQKRKVAKRRAELKEAGIDVADVDNEKIDGLEASAASMLEFLEKARSGELIPPDVIIRYANLFQDDLTLDNMPRMQLINMCKYMAIPPYGSESFLRFQLRHRIRVLKEDDQRILWEGIDSLTKMELREACQERGMRSTGLSKEAYKRSLQQWLDLSVNKNVPISLLVMSRTFFLNKEENLEKSDDGSQSVTGLADAISGLDKDVLDQVILEVATSQEKTSDPEITKLKLEVLSQQNELIRQEKAEREAAASKKKEAAEKETAEQESSGEETKESAAAPSDAAASLAAAPLVPPVAEDVRTEPPSETKKDNGEKDESLSTEEMDLLSQIVSGDPVSKERAELERIKAAMKSEASIKEVAKTLVSVPQQDASSSEPMTSEEAERMVADTVEKLEQQVKAAAEGSTQFSLDGSNTSTENSTETVDEEEEEEPEDPVVARLKKKLESMVDKIEVQLTDAHIKIGNKMHLLDKDNDGILTREEMADALQSVLKREITFEEAMVIADEMDENHDGFFTVDELIKWIDKHKLVKYVEEGKDADLDWIMESQSSESKKEKEEPPASTKVETPQ